MPQGTPFSHTESVVKKMLKSLEQTRQQLPPEDNGVLVRNIQVSYSANTDAGEEGVHLATISLDLLDAEKRNTSLNELRRLWSELTPTIPGAIAIQFKAPKLGPADKAISIRLQGENLDQL